MKMKTLIIVIHPDIKNSRINKRWIQELEKFPGKYHIHQLHEVYPGQIFDIAAEQKLIEEHERIIFQFPFYWYHGPALLKRWMDVVLTHGWAYGSTSGYKFRGKKVAIAISLGLKEDEVQKGGAYKYSLEEMTRPFELTFGYVKADYRPMFAYYGMAYNPSEEWIEKSVPLYLNFLDQFQAADDRANAYKIIS
jgi:putative NADPH-quinone reductase